MFRRLSYIAAIISITTTFSCQNNTTKNRKDAILKDTNSGSIKVSNCNVEYYSLSENLSKEEKDFLVLLTKENPDIFFLDKVKRVYDAKDSTLVFSQLVIPRDTLINRGYVYFDFTFLGGINNESDVNIIYNYSLGQADYGSGSIYGLTTKDYFHSFTQYGLSAKTVTLYNNGKELNTQTIELAQ